MKEIGYCRVSSLKQLDGYGLDTQEKEILLQYPNAIIYKEQYSAKFNNRPVLKELLSHLESGDLLVVSKLDRLARSVKEGLDICDDLFNRGVNIHVLNVGKIENNTMGKFFLSMMLSFAEMERNYIIERTNAGRDFAKKNNPNYKDGRPKKYKREQMNHAMQLLDTHSYKVVSELTGISISTLARAKRELKAKKIQN